MMVEPNLIVLYVDDIARTSQFHQDFLEVKPEEASSTFHSFRLLNGMSLALKAKYSIILPTKAKKGNGELAFGYTFVALAPDGHRLRVVSIGEV